MSTLPSSMTEATTRRASSFPTYFASRIALAFLLTGFDVLVLAKSALAGLRDSLDMPFLHSVLVIAIVGIALTLANVWYKAFRYRQPSKPGSHNPLH